MSIVQVNVNQILAPTPNTLQQTGAAISQGGTTLAANASSLLTQEDDLTPLLAAPLAIASLAWSGGTVLATTSAPIPGLSAGDKFITTIATAVPAGYNGLVQATVTGASTFTYPLASNPGAETTPGTYTPPGVGELVAMISSYFAQGATQAVWVLELGAGDGATGPTALDTYLTANPVLPETPPPAGVFYSYLVPRSWDGQANFLTLLGKYENPSALINFFITTTTGTYAAAYTPQMADGFAEVEAPGLALTSFDCAQAFQASLAYNPSSSNRMTPFGNKFLFGSTPYPKKGNAALLQTLRTANINYVGTGAEGGISTAILTGGKMLDGNDFTYRYAIGWAKINGDLVLANEVINGANNSANPLWYDQNGIDRLQDRAVKLLLSGVSFALLQGDVTRTKLDGTVFQQNFDNDVYENQCVVNAVPLLTYTEENPSHYAAGIYNGLTLLIIPKRGFQQIIVNLTVSNLIAA